MQDSVRIAVRENLEAYVARLKVSKRNASTPEETTTPTATLSAFVEGAYLHLTVSLQLSPEAFLRMKAEMARSFALALNARLNRPGFESRSGTGGGLNVSE